ncbi:MAG: hypothetical protein Q8K89_11790 [Actinomycetota bacterium]|nr:hypothetical protein [Actinomycetota bacterium]
MSKTLAEKLNAEAPPWLQAAFFGLFVSSAVAMVVLVLASFVLPDAVSELTPYLVVGVALATFAVYTIWATPRLSVLRMYSESLADALDEPIAVARGRVWSMQGPGWRTVGVAVLVPFAALMIPLSLLTVALISVPWDPGGLRALTPVGWLLVGVSVAITVAIGWLAYRLSKPDETMRLLGQAARESERAPELIERAVDETRGVYPRSAASWIAGAAFYTWAGGQAYGQLTQALDVGLIPVTAVWVIVSCAVAMFAIRRARRGGAPVYIWTGVALWVLLGAAFASLVYLGAWDAFGVLMTETDAGDWPAPAEYMRQIGVHLLANMPLVVSSWVTAVKTQSGSTPLA